MDLDWYVRAVLLDWERFAMLVEKHKMKTIVFLALSIPQAFWNTPVPERVIQRFHPSRWRTRRIADLLSGVDLLALDRPGIRRWQYALLNLLFLDDPSGIWRGVFPSRAWMRERYGFRSDLFLPYYHGRRLVDLALHREAT
jgi:hypothetical protein